MSTLQTTTREEQLLGSIRSALETKKYADSPAVYKGSVPSTHSLKELLITSSIDMETTTNTTVTALCTIDEETGTVRKTGMIPTNLDLSRTCILSTGSSTDTLTVNDEHSVALLPSHPVDMMSAMALYHMQNPSMLSFDFSPKLQDKICDSDPAETVECFERLLLFTKEGESVHRSALAQVIFPTFVHVYLDFVASGHSGVAQNFYNKYFSAVGMAHQLEMNELSEIVTAEQLATSQLASKFRSQKYWLRMDSRAFQLLMQFLQLCSTPVLLNLIQQHLAIEVFGSTPLANGDQKGEQKNKAVPQAPTFTKPNIPQLHSDPPPTKKKKSGVHPNYPSSLGSSTGGGGAQKFTYGSPRSGLHSPSLGGGMGGFTIATGSVGEEGSEALAGAGKLKPMQRTSSMTAPHPTHLTEFKDRLLSACQFDPCPPSIVLYTVQDGQGRRQGAHCSSFSTASELFSCGFQDSSIHLWSQLPVATAPPPSHHMTSIHHLDAPSNQPIRLQKGSCSDHCVLLGHHGPVYSTCFNSTGQYLLSASEDSTVRLWHTGRRSSAVCYRGHAYPVWDVTFSPVDVYFASSSYDQTGRLWCTDLAFPLRIFAGHTAGVNVVRFHPNGKYVATGSSDHTCRLWDIQNGNCVRLMTGSKGAINCIAFSPSGKQLVSGGVDGVVQLWDLGSGNVVKEFKGHPEAVTSLAYSLDGTLLASSCHGNQIRFWNMRTASIPPTASVGVNLETDLVSQHVTPGTCALSLHFTHRNCLVAIATTTYDTSTTYT